MKKFCPDIYIYIYIPFYLLGLMYIRFTFIKLNNSDQCVVVSVWWNILLIC